MTIRGRIVTMPGWKSALFGLALVAAPASAMAQAAEPAVQPSADRLAAAQRVMGALMPEEQRDAMIEQMISALMANMVEGVKRGLGADTRLARSEAGPVFDRFVKRQEALAIAQLKTELPAMIDAMARAYARRFSAEQLDEMHAFFRTPTGQLYVRESMNIMADPDVAAWQRNSMAKSMEKMPAEMKLLVDELEKAFGPPAKEKDA